MRLLVLDGNSIVNRAFYGIKLLTTRDGRYTNAIYGFMNILLNLLKEYHPDEVAVAFDEKAPTFRHKAYDGYKAGRHAMPEELASQMPVLKDLLDKLGFVRVSREGWEADDILGTLSAACSARGDECLLATGDRDSLQLIGDKVTVLLATSRMGRSETKVMTPEAIREQYGLSDPRQLIEVKSLMGDTSDNIPGVAGIGEKTALALIGRFGSLEEVYAHLDDPAVKPGMRKKLEEHKAEAELSQMLGTIRIDAPVETAPGAYRRGEGDPAGAAHLLNELEMKSLLPRLGLDGPLPAQTDLEEVPALPLPGELAGEYALACQPLPKEKGKPEEGVWYAVAGRAVYRLEEEDLLRLLDAPGVSLRVFDSQPLYLLALAHGQQGSAIRADEKLAAYLLSPATNRYLVEELAAGYGVQPAFRCEGLPDAGLLEGLFAALEKGVEEEGMGPLLEEIEFPLARVLASMTHTGMLVDRQGLEEFGAALRAELENCLERIYKEVGYTFNLNSPKQLGEALFDKMGLPSRKKTKSGYSTDAETLESLRPYSPVVDDILRYRTYQKLNSTYAEGLLKALAPDGRLHSTFNQTEARTGRLSSSEPNLQNIPIRTELGSQLRRYFVASPGHVLLDADYSQIELRLLAHISGDETMRQAFRNGEDIHRSTAAKIYSLPPEEITPRLRASAKAVNFGIVYGIGAFSLAKDIGVSVPEAKAFIENYLGHFPGVREYMEKTVAQGREKGYVSTLFGRRRALPELASSNRNVQALGERMAMNTPIQGTAADIIKLAMVRVWQRLQKEGLKARLILQVHDELIVEAPLEEAEAAARILGEEMSNVVEYSVPLTADVQQGGNWLEAHG